LRILHVVTVADGVNSFGGPTVVCRNIAFAQARRGDDVTIVAGYERLHGPMEFGETNVRIKLFNGNYLLKRRPASFFSAQGLGWMVTHARDFDVVHFHGGREPFLLALEFATIVRRTRFVIQTHGMIDAARHVSLAMRVLLCFVFERAAGILALTDKEAQVVRDRYNASSVIALKNSVEPSRPTEHTRSDVVFCARLHPRKGVQSFLDAVAILIGEGLDIHFVVAGVDEGCLSAVESAERRFPKNLEYRGALSPTDARKLIQEAKILVVTAKDEPFGMTIAEGLIDRTPIVLTSSVELATRLDAAGAVWLSEGTPLGVAETIRLILASPNRTEERAAAGYDWAVSHLSVESILSQIDSIYASTNVA
jgi:glycosyltransferase involved in cell wall biosynthesis